MTSRNPSTNRIDALLFDLDGTLIDTAADFVAVLNAQRRSHGFKPLDEQMIRNTVSNGARALTHLAFGGSEGEPDFEAYRQELLENYLSIVGQQASLFPGMDDVLKRCHENQIPWGIITNKPRRFTEKLLDTMNLHQACSLVICADDVSKPKPHPESMLLAAEKLNIDLSKSVYVGDHARDIAAGKAANMITVAAAYGYILEDDLPESWEADFIIHQPIELKTLFLS